MARLDANAVLVDLGRRVAELRVAKDLTQEQFAAKLDVTVQYLQRVERGRENLTVRSIVRLANLLSVSALGDLFDTPKGDKPVGRPRKTGAD